jgi:hypothetical protein
LEQEKSLLSTSEKSSVSRGHLGVLVPILAFLSGWFFSQLSGTPNNERANGIPPKNDSDDESNNGNEFSNLVVKVPPGPTDHENRCKCCHHKAPRWKTVADVFMTLFTGGAFVAATIYACITYRMQQDNALAFRIDERAWVTLFEASPFRDRENDWSIRLGVKNSGKTPAKAFKIKAAYEVPGTTATEDLLPGVGVIAPDGLFHFMLTAPGKSAKVMIHGTLEYESVFGHKHWTKFCTNFEPTRQIESGGLYACEAGNDTDSDPP